VSGLSGHRHRQDRIAERIGQGNLTVQAGAGCRPAGCVGRSSGRWAVAAALLVLVGCNRDEHARSVPSLAEDLHPVTPITPETALPFPSAAAVDAGFVYWLNYDARTLSRMPKEGGAVAVLAATRALPRALVLDATHAYWAEDLPAPAAAERVGAVMHVPKTGGAPAPLVQVDGETTALAVDDDNVYFATRQAVSRVPKIGGAPTQLATTRWAFAITVDATAVYIADYQDGTINRVAKSGGPMTVLAREQRGPSSLTHDDESLYWVSYDHRLLRMPKAGEQPIVLLDGIGVYEACGNGLAVDATALYVTACCDSGTYAGRIIRIPRGAGAPTVLAKDIYKPCNPVVDETAVFWTTTTTELRHALLPGGAVLRITK
jgi:hypothetical protein